jgi:hypothetical protein
MKYLFLSVTAISDVSLATLLRLLPVSLFSHSLSSLEPILLISLCVFFAEACCHRIQKLAGSTFSYRRKPLFLTGFVISIHSIHGRFHRLSTQFVRSQKLRLMHGADQHNRISKEMPSRMREVNIPLYD